MLIVKHAIKLRITVFALTAMLVIVGPIIYYTLPREGMPDVTIPYVFVTVPYEGVAPSEIENLITIPLEKQFKDLENVKEINATSAEGLCFISVEFTPRQNIDSAAQKVKDKIDLAKPDMPRDLDQPIVKGLNLSTDIPVLNFTVSGSTDPERLKSVAEDLQDLVETVPGVLQARLYGTREREIRVELDLIRLIAHKLTIGDVFAALQKENTTISAGNLETRRGKFQVRVPGEFTDVRQIARVVVKVTDGVPKYLDDVATVTDTYKDLTTISRINGAPCVTIAVHKRAGENADSLIKEVKKCLAAHGLPTGLTITIVDDQSEMIRLMIEDLENNIFSGLVMVIVILLLFMGWRNSILVAITIPLSMMLGFVVLALLGLTLNMMVLFSLVLTVGMLVDNAIVIVENIYRHHSEGENRIDAAINGASEVAWPVTTSTLTTLAAFWPLLYWPGIMGQFMSFLPETVIVVLSASLFVALVINPPICAMLVNRNLVPQSIEEPGRWQRFMNGYEAVLRGALVHRWPIMIIGFLFLVFTFVVFSHYNSGVELFPDVQPRRASIQVHYPEGTDIETTDATLRTIESKLAAFKDIKFFLATAGSSGSQHLSMTAFSPHTGSIQIEFKPFGERSGDTIELVKQIRSAVGVWPGAEIRVEPEEMGPPSGSPVSIEISGDDFDKLQEIADDVKRRIRDVPGLVDVQDNLEDARPELQFRVDRERAAVLGLDTAAIGHFLRTAINGDTATKFRAGEDEYDVTVRLKPDQRRSSDLLKLAYIANHDDFLIPLASVGTVSYAGGHGQIMRKNQKRVITVSGNKQDRGVDKILADIMRRLESFELPKGYSINYSGDNKDMIESSNFLIKAFLIALVLISLILIMEFNSIVLPTIIMISVILSMIGVFWSLLTTGMRFGVIMTGIGVISLAGVVVNNGIVLIDCIRQRIAHGMPVTEAIITGGRLRLRPVLLTAMSTVIGLLPMAIGWSLEIHRWPPRLVASTETGSWWAPMAVAVIYGLTLATILTLVQVPVMFSLFDSAIQWFRRKFARNSSPTPPGD